MQVAELNETGEGPAPLEPRTGTTSLESAVGLMRATGEHIVAVAQCEQLIGRGDFQRAAVVLTDRRFLLVSYSPDTGYSLSAAEERSTYRSIVHKAHADGSMLVVLMCGHGHQSLYFKPSWRREAELVLEAFATPPVGRAEPEVDRFALAQEFAGLYPTTDEEEDDTF